MDMDAIRDFMGSEAGMYTAGGAIAVVSYIAGRLSGKKRERREERNYKLEIARVNLETEKAKLGQANAGDTVRLKELEYEEARRIRDHEKEVDGIERSRTLEDTARAREQKLEDLSREEAERAKERTHELKLVESLSGHLAPVVESYVSAMKTYFEGRGDGEKGADFLRERSLYRQRLVDAHVTAMEEDQGYNAWNEEFDVSEEDKERIDRIVDAKFPLNDIDSMPKMPEELGRLISLLEDTEEKE